MIPLVDFSSSCTLLRHSLRDCLHSVSRLPFLLHTLASFASRDPVCMGTGTVRYGFTAVIMQMYLYWLLLLVCTVVVFGVAMAAAVL